MPLNLILTLVVLVAGAVAVGFLYVRRKNERKDAAIVERLTIDRLLNIVKTQLSELVKEDTLMGKNDEEWEAAYKRKKRLRLAMKNCVYGIDADKIIVKDLIRDVIAPVLPDVTAISEIIDFNGSYLDPMYKWEVLMYFLKKKYRKDAMSYLIKTYHWDRVRHDIEGGEVAHHLVTTEDLNAAYSAEITRPLTYYEQLDVMATILFTKYKGFGCIDTLREQNVDGINMGTSGSIISSFLDVDSNLPRAARSIWIYYEGKYIHLDYLTTYTEEEMRRIILLICMYNNPGSLTEKRGYMVNTMYDKTRVLAIRPGAGEYWAVFLRKFNIKNVTLEKLYCKPGIDPDSAIIPISLIKWFMIGRVTCAFTGRQGTGKTTAMIASIAAIDARLTIRILEMAPEMYLRERYPDRNIYSVSETQYVTAAELQDALKKSDAAVSIVGEVATDAIAARMIQMGQVASLFTIFSHHANRAKDLVNAITNSIVASNGGGATAATIQPQVIDVIKIDVHMDFDVTGFRYFERITEIIPVDHVIPKYDPKHHDASLAAIQRAYYEITAVGELFTTRDIIVFDRKTKQYKAVNMLSKRLTEYMLKNIPEDRLHDFAEFIRTYWKG